MHDRSHLLTELRLPESMNLDAMSVEEAVAIRENDRVGRALADGAIELCDCVSIVHA